MYTDHGLYDTWLGMALFYTAIAIPFCLFVLRGFFSTIPPEIQDAARLDGASDFRIYWRIFMPLARGPIAVLLLFQFTWIWNDLLFGLVLSTSDGVRPITPSLLGLQGVYANSGPPVVLAGALIGSLPTVVLFLFLGRYLLRGLVLSTGLALPGAEPASVGGHGRQRVLLYVPETREPRPLVLAVEAAGTRHELPFELRPQRRWEVYLCHQSHLDIGYTGRQDLVLAHHLR